MIFKMKADIKFEADSIDDAFDKLMKYFKGLSGDEEEYEQLIIKGNIDISRVKEE